MPSYEMENLATGKIELFFIPITEYPSLGEVREIDGEKWRRVITEAPMGIVKSSDNPTLNNFINESASKRGTVGDLMEKSQEMSEKRAKDSVNGRDPVKDKWFDRWSKKRDGKQHPSDTRPKKRTRLKIRK